MKKIIVSLVLLLLVCIGPVSAQQLYVGPDLGLDVIPMGAGELNRNYQLGLLAGLGTEYYFSDKIGLKSGLFFNQDRKRSDTYSSYSLLNNFQSLFASFGLGSDLIDSLAGLAGVDFSVNQKTSEFLALNSLIIPVQAAYKTSHVEFALGPYIGFNIGGRKKQSLTTTVPFLQAIDVASYDTTGMLKLLLPQPESVQISQSSLPGYVRGFEYGLTASLVYWANDLRFGVHYLHSFVDYRNPAPDGSFKPHRALRFSLAWRFNLSELISNVPSMKRD